MNSKYSNLLTILLVIIIIAIIGIIGFLGYRYYKTITTEESAEDFVDAFQSSTNTTTSTNTTDTSNSNVNVDELLNEIASNKTSSTSSTTSVPTYNGYNVSGTIEIPATSVKLPILETSALSSAGLDTSVIEVYGSGLNQVGNTTIMGHNYRNGTFFSNNKKLEIGDKIYITDLTGTRLSYTIYNKYETTDTDSEYMTRDTGGAIEVSLSTCTDDSQNRLIIWAKADS